jgi:pimeloyl-ACP methyl ester carboxylesterase
VEHAPGRDLAAVLDAVVPAGPVVLAGHSMGGMTIMALARRHPELFGPRVVGVFLLATSAGGLVETGLLGRRVGLLRRLRLPRLWLASIRLAPLLERLRRRGTVWGRWFTGRYLFGRDDADPALVRRVQDLLERTRYPVTMAFYATFLDHHEEESLRCCAGSRSPSSTPPTTGSPRSRMAAGWPSCSGTLRSWSSCRSRRSRPTPTTWFAGSAIPTAGQGHSAAQGDFDLGLHTHRAEARL